jgi:hypothetical protein
MHLLIGLSLQQCSTEDRREEPNPQASLLANDDNNVKPDIPVVLTRASNKH